MGPGPDLANASNDQLDAYLRRAKKMIRRYADPEGSYTADLAFNVWCREYVRISDECDNRIRHLKYRV